MDIAIITERYPEGNVKTLRSTVFPPTPKLEQQAEELDRYLSNRIRALENELSASDEDNIAPLTRLRGSTGLWYSVGRVLRNICQTRGIRGSRERSWLWEAIEKMHASSKISRLSRGRTRRHFEYCYRLAQYPEQVAKRMNWSEWVYFFDSLTVREEPRADDWLAARLRGESGVDRLLFRRFVENLNARIKGKDTSVLGRKELYRIYDRTWDETKSELSRDPRRRSETAATT